MRNGRETVPQAGDETLGGKRNSNPYGDVILVESARRPPIGSGEHELHVMSSRQ